MTLDELIQRGFDETEAADEDGYLRPRCSQCQAKVIQGAPCHENGCTNATHECAECMALIPRTHRLCESCANPEPFEDDEGTCEGCGDPSNFVFCEVCQEKMDG